MALIELRGINKAFQDGEARVNHVLRDLCLTAERGDFIAVQGQSGAGKTTLLRVLGTLLQPDSGTYLLDGQPLTDGTADLPRVRNRRIGFVFQDHRLLPQYDVMQNILLPTLAEADRSTAEQVERAHRLMELTNIARLERQMPETLSGGEACRVAVCRALINEPLLLLADEPTGQLDRDNAETIAALFRKVNLELGTTIVMVTHSEQTARAAHYTLTLADGILTRFEGQNEATLS